MNGVAERPRRDMAQTVFVAAAIAIVVLFFVFPKEAARGWLIAFSVFSQIGLGSLALLLIHNLTGTCWGAAFGPVFRRLLWGVPLLAIFFIAVAVNLRAIYPWAATPASIPQDVARIYLNPAGFWLRSVIALAGWIFFAALLLRGNIGRLTAALGLTFFGLSSYVLGYDWILSIGAPFISSSFNAEMAIQAMLAALAAAALFAPAIPNDTAKSDLGAFLIAGCLAVFYFELMALHHKLVRRSAGSGQMVSRPGRPMGRRSRGSGVLRSRHPDRLAALGLCPRKRNRFAAYRCFRCSAASRCTWSGCLRPSPRRWHWSPRRLQSLPWWRPSSRPDQWVSGFSPKGD